MDRNDRFARLAQRDTAFAALAARGRRRSVVLMILACLPSPFLVMMLNDDSSFTSLIPIPLACLGGISYSWSKWKRRPEDTQSIAFVGLSRTQRGSTYRSMWRGSRIDDPVVLTIVEAMHQHMRRGLWLAVATTILAGALGGVLVASSGGGGVVWFSLAIVVLVTTTVAGLRWVNDRAGLVIRHSHPS